MKKGINRADTLQKAYAVLESNEPKTICVFLSHKSQDKDSCKEIAKYLSDAGIDYYLDELDAALQRAVSAKDPYAITESIKKGIRESTHMLVVVSAITFNSPWIPFEIGFGHAAIIDRNDTKINLAVLTLKDAAEKSLPDFMRTAYEIRGTQSLNVYIAQITGLNESILKSEKRLFSHLESRHPLDDVLNWQL